MQARTLEASEYYHHASRAMMSPAAPRWRRRGVAVATPELPMHVSDPEMTYVECLPAPALMPWVSAHWSFRVAPGAGAIEHTIPLTGGAMLVVPRGGEPLVAGPRVTPLRTTVHGGDVTMGSHLWPGVARALFARVPALALREQILPLRVLAGDGVAGRLADFFAAIDADDAGPAGEHLDAVLADLAERAAPLDARAMTTVFHIVRAGGRRSIEEIARTVGISARQLRRRFRAATELSPKELARIRRVRASLIDAMAMPANRWVALAAEHGYADQAHLVREYRSLLGLTPGRFDEHARRIEHGPILS